VLKTAVLVLIVVVVIAGQFRDIVRLPMGDAGSALSALAKVTLQLVAATAFAFVLVAALDASYQRFSFLKKMRMSRRDIRQELKDTEGDPLIRGQRRQLHQEWANRNSVEAARNASVLVVNPTHIAIALDYDPAIHPAPVVAAKGEGPLAAEMRQAAEAAGVPVIRNVDLARGLYERAELDDIVPEDMFAAVAEVILWARRFREEAVREAQGAGGPA
jgi:type III secretion protein U